ncbi:MAG: superoxide dismutase [Armatimonadetes bacterium CG_4_10_14_3_um_filter_66_18]|nr:superoxide dismutase [Armatimonadota bacterium]OIP04613.1 MAG: superoxide dismutase [Armatimonadetes bacterium CG2_30_66_41]PIX45098.1 MAG: superoxide dismutase [Armatimonadetes bacterium CG_4_8_14_3_um_filter_66_20]PIY36631.1 MAG: superoxide dismutase [Armatimonadetes bacterium CG_4_10_14_3_um_filter_66_18]PIZ41396.1 MAG: superoxide dismutase [Armatimonadetes bacterium CG_4_10_14_0_8_um_filter_66_14]PJB60076.1 MAG: superoxide dismutase [Armatimonadetes bacterium CG_4_9_14_3_um_filter_66_14
MAHELPKLPYAYDALEPYIDARTMEIHHTKHHQAYLDKLNAAVAGTEWEETCPCELLTKLGDLPEDLRTAVRNNGGGYVNHGLFWEVMSPTGGGEPDGKLAEAIKRDFGSLDAFKEEFSKAAATRFGSGWAWLYVKGDRVLGVSSAPNQDNPVMCPEVKLKPILGLDVWEHAYYLNYQNRRPDYIAAWWNVVNWAKVAEFYACATKHECCESGCK